MIPKVIHQFWIGEKPAPEKLMQTWMNAHPDWEIIQWNEAELARRYPQGLECQRQYDVMPELAGKCDIARWEILRDYGGVFIEADNECVHPLDDWLLEPGFFTAYVNEQYVPGMIATSFMGCVPQHPVVTEAVAGVTRMTDNEVWLGPHVYNGQSAWMTLSNLYIKKVLDIVGPRDDVVIHPSFRFLPDYYGRVCYTGDETVYARHYWGSTPNSGFDY